MGGIIVQLITVLAPLIMQVVRDHQAAHQGQLPTNDEMIAQLQAHIDTYLAEGAAWNQTHPIP